MAAHVGYLVCSKVLLKKRGKVSQKTEGKIIFVKRYVFFSPQSEFIPLLYEHNIQNTVNKTACLLGGGTL